MLFLLTTAAVAIALFITYHVGFVVGFSAARHQILDMVDNWLDLEEDMESAMPKPETK